MGRGPKLRKAEPVLVAKAVTLGCASLRDPMWWEAGRVLIRCRGWEDGSPVTSAKQDECLVKT